jgi:hypothetical protein
MERGRQDAGRGNGDDHGRADAKGAVNTGSGTGAWNTAHGNGGRHDCNPARSNLGYNPGPLQETGLLPSVF